MQTLTDLPSLSAWRKKQSLAGQTVALVPTMGNLHDGHLSLVRLAKARADQCLVSIFVNPTQFGPDEDFNTYPRTLTADLEKLTAAGANAVFAPPRPEILYSGTPIKLVAPPHLSQRLCGAFRPGHFDGVLQVVNKLFNLCSPELAIFGEKDYQQLLLIKIMVADFLQPITVLSGPTTREPSGLAMSSRNQYLTESEKTSASALHQHLLQTLAALQDSTLATHEDYNDHCQQQMAALDQLGFKMQYYEICDADSLIPLGCVTKTNHIADKPPHNSHLKPSAQASADEITNDPVSLKTSKPLVIVAAGYLGKTRLIDNIPVRNTNETPPSSQIPTN